MSMVKLIAYALLFWKGFDIMSDMQTKRMRKVKVQQD